MNAAVNVQAMDKAQRQHLDNVKTEATEERQRELARGADQALHALAPIYSLVVLDYSTYKQVTPSVVVGSFKALHSVQLEAC